MSKSLHTPPVAFEWAANPLKLHQAEDYVRTQGQELTEENIKARYIEIQGEVRATDEVAAPAKKAKKVGIVKKVLSKIVKSK